MLTSLFGDLGASRGGRKTNRGPADDAPDGGFAATAILESVASEITTRGETVDRHHRDLVVTGSAAFAIRSHFADTRADLAHAARMITLVDPTGVWASGVLKALSDATGRPIERMQLREQTTLRSLATIERTVLLRRHDEPLKIYTAEVRAPGRDNAAIPMALAERSHLTAVIVGPLAPTGIDDLMHGLAEASRAPTWACPHLLFMLPPQANWIAAKVRATDWPAGTSVICIDEPLVSASSVWNALLGVWNRVKHDAVVKPLGQAALLGLGELPIKVAELPGEASDTSYGTSELAGLGADSVRAGLASARAAAPPAERPSPALDRLRAQQTLADLLLLDGLVAAAVVDARTGLLLAHEQRGDPPVSLETAASAASQALRAQRHLVRSLGLPDRVEEVVTAAGPRQLVVRGVSRQPDALLLVVLDKHRSNLALARFRVMEAERSLV